MIDNIHACTYHCIHSVAYCRVCRDQVLSTLFKILVVTVCSINLIFLITCVQIFICFLHDYYVTLFCIRESVLQINMLFNICSDGGACKNMLYVYIILSLSFSLSLVLQST